MFMTQKTYLYSDTEKDRLGRLRDNPDYLRAAAEYLGGVPFS